MFFPLNVVHNREGVGWVRGGGQKLQQKLHIFSIFFSQVIKFSVNCIAVWLQIYFLNFPC